MALNNIIYHIHLYIFDNNLKTNLLYALYFMDHHSCVCVNPSIIIIIIKYLHAMSHTWSGQHTLEKHSIDHPLIQSFTGYNNSTLS